MTDEDVTAGLKAACERIRLLGCPYPRPVYDPGSPLTSTPKPLIAAVPPPHQDTDTDTEGDE